MRAALVDVNDVRPLAPSQRADGVDGLQIEVAREWSGGVRDPVLRRPAGHEIVRASDDRDVVTPLAEPLRGLEHLVDGPRVELVLVEHLKDREGVLRVHGGRS